MNRIKQAFNKLIFCRKITADLSSCIKLLWFTKKYKWNKNNLENISADAVHKYNIRFDKKKFDLYLRTYSGDIDIFYEIFLNEVYKTASLSSATLIVDLGANIGLASLYFTNKCTGAKIIAVEPDPGNANILRMNLAKQISENKAVVVEAAIADKEQQLFLYSPALKYNAAITEEETNDKQKIVVKGLKINTLIRENNITNIDLLKVDIEGGETDLFSGDTSWLHIVTEIIMEIHSAVAKEKSFSVLLHNGFGLQHQNDKIYYWKK